MSFAELKTVFESLYKGFVPEKEIDVEDYHFYVVQPDDMLKKSFKGLKQYLIDLKSVASELKFKTYTNGYGLFDESGCLYCYDTTDHRVLFGFACTDNADDLVSAIDAYVAKVQNNMNKIENKIKLQRPTFNTNISM